MAEHRAQQCNRSLKARGWLQCKLRMLKSRSILAKNMGADIARKEAYSDNVNNKLRSVKGRLPKSRTAVNRPLTPQLVFTKLNSPQFPVNKQKKIKLNSMSIKASELESTSSHARRDSFCDATDLKTEGTLMTQFPTL